MQMDGNKRARISPRASWLKQAFLGIGFVASMALSHGPAMASRLPATTVASLNTLADPSKLVPPYIGSGGVTFGTLPTGTTFNFASVPAGEFPGVDFYNLANVDFSAAGGTAVDVTNPMSSDVTFYMAITDSSNNSIVIPFTIPANSSQTVCALHHVNSSAGLGMFDKPSPYQSVVALDAPWSSPIDLAHVAKVHIYVKGPSPAETLIFNNLRLLAPYSLNQLLTGAVDQYGQNSLVDFTGKLHADGEFATRRSSEEASFGAPLLAGHIDQYGGSLDLPTQAGTGHFRTQNVGGRWWLIDPIGHPFIMAGVDTLDPLDQATVVTGRNYMFSSLPAPTDPLAQNYGTFSNVFSGPVSSGTSYNFYTANLQRKYGPAWQSNWNSTLISRLKDWGFNTMGSFSGHTSYPNGVMPYVLPIGSGSGFKTVSTGSDIWGAVPDPFDPAFATTLASRASWPVTQSANDPMLIGYSVDNELSWVGTRGDRPDLALATGTLALDASASPAKAAFVQTLQLRYQRIQRLNAYWGTRFQSWAELSAPATITTKITAWADRDLTGWVGTYANKYYSTVRNVLKHLAPNALYLGSSLGNYSEAVYRSASVNTDVISLNCYATTVPDSLAKLATTYNKPILLTEYSRPSLESGLFGPGFGSASNNATRASDVGNFVNQMLDLPQFVGCNWFQYVDHAVTGRVYDGENFNVGFVDVTDTPYPTMVQMAKTVHLGMYARHNGNPGGLARTHVLPQTKP